jgi:hypothetical protein
MIKIDKNSSYFSTNKISIVPMLLDFGYAMKMDDEDISEIHKLFKESSFEDIMRILCAQRRSDNSSIMGFEPKYYGYLCGKFDPIGQKEKEGFDPHLNERIANLYRLRNNSILQRKNNKSFPFKLPLTDDKKNELIKHPVSNIKKRSPSPIKKQKNGREFHLYYSRRQTMKK